MKTLKYVEGNLLTSNIVGVMGHSCNCQNVFGSGIARSIREMYPEAYKADCDAARKGHNTLGSLSMATLNPRDGVGITHIFNLYGQNLGTEYGKTYLRKTNYEALYVALEKMMTICSNDLNYPIVGFPYKMGSALGGGSWDVVSRLIEVAFDNYLSDVYIVELKQ